MELEQIIKLLEIEDLQDIRTIKKAYAKQVALHHPEEEPQLFAQLQAAYHEAVRYAHAQQSAAFTAPATAPGDETQELEQSVDISSLPAEEQPYEAAAQTGEETAAELAQQLAEVVRSGINRNLMDLLYAADRLQLLSDVVFMRELSDRLQRMNMELPYAMRKPLLDAFDLQKSNLCPEQRQLLNAIQNGVPQFQTYRYSCKRDKAYLLDTWEALCSEPQEDTAAWLEFLNRKNWEEEGPALQTMDKILSIELQKRYSHSSAVAGKIYSFLHIREYLSQDPQQTCARMKLLLSKDASFTKQDFISWQHDLQKQCQQFALFSGKHQSVEEWKNWLQEQHMDRDDLELLKQLSERARLYHYHKAVLQLLISYFDLENAETAVKRELKDALLEEPQAYRTKKRRIWLLISLIVLSAVLFPLFSMHARQQREARAKEQETLRDIQETIMEESRKNTQEQMDALLQRLQEAGE